MPTPAASVGAAPVPAAAPPACACAAAPDPNNEPVSEPVAEEPASASAAAGAPVGAADVEEGPALPDRVNLVAPDAAPRAPAALPVPGADWAPAASALAAAAVEDGVGVALCACTTAA